MKTPPAKCLHCGKPAICRGLCQTAYAIALAMVKGGVTTWKALEDNGKAAPLKREYTTREWLMSK
jgi:hypothetical protein